MQAGFDGPDHAWAQLGEGDDGPLHLARPGSGVHAPYRPKNVAADAVRTGLARARASIGFSNPYFEDVRHTLEAGWHPEQLREDPKTLGDRVKRVVKDVGEFLGAWGNHAQRFGQGGSPLDHDERLSDDRTPEGSGSAQMNQLQGFAAMFQRKFKLPRHAEIRVMQDENGHVVAIDLIQPSPDAALDRMAMADVRAAAERLPRPPVDLLDEEKHVVSLWDFEATLEIVPPTVFQQTAESLVIGPQLVFDEDGARIPLSQHLIKSVRLLEGR